jgi:hypothetical protein
MTTILNNVLDQALDVGGSLTQSQTMVRTEEPLFLGSRIAGQTGSGASITNSSGTIVVSGLTVCRSKRWQIYNYPGQQQAQIMVHF